MAIGSSEALAELAAQYALTKKAEGVLILDLRELTGITDFFVLCSGASDVQVKAIADAIIEGLETRGSNAWHVEGYSNLRWVLIDYVDVVVHIFLRSTREFYGLDRLWGDAPMKAVEPSQPAEAAAPTAASGGTSAGAR